MTTSTLEPISREPETHRPLSSDEFRGQFLKVRKAQLSTMQDALNRNLADLRGTIGRAAAALLGDESTVSSDWEVLRTLHQKLRGGLDSKKNVDAVMEHPPLTPEQIALCKQRIATLERALAEDNSSQIIVQLEVDQLLCERLAHHNGHLEFQSFSLDRTLTLQDLSHGVYNLRRSPVVMGEKRVRIRAAEGGSWDTFDAENGGLLFTAYPGARDDIDHAQWIPDQRFRERMLSSSSEGEEHTGTILLPCVGPTGKRGVVQPIVGLNAHPTYEFRAFEEEREK